MPNNPAWSADTGTYVAGNNSALNITATTLVKSTPGRLASISVLVAGTTVGRANDAATTAGAAAANQILVIPQAVTTEPLVINWPCKSGIVITPGTGQTLAVSYS